MPRGLLLGFLVVLFLFAGGGATRAHDGILTTHAAVESSLKLGAEGQLAHVVCLFVAEHHTLGREGFILHAVEI